MSELIAEGIWPCTVISGEAGEQPDKPGVIKVRINTKIDEGPSKGRLSTYEDEVNARSAPYVSRSMKAAGWKGKTVTTFAEDCAAWIKETGGKSTVEIKHIEIKRGKRYDEWVAKGRVGDPPIWDKANAIGRGATPLAKPQKATLADADSFLRSVSDDEGAPPEDDVPPNPEPTLSPDEIPF